MKKILDIAINPCGIGGTETFSRVLNRHFNNSITYSHSRLEKPIFDARFVLIKRPIHLKILRKLSLNRIPKRNLFSYPSSGDNIVIINAPCDFDNIPFRVLRNNKVIYVAHSAPNHIWTHGNYFGAHRESRLKALQYVDRIVCFSQDHIEPLANYLQYPVNRFRVATHSIEIEAVHKPKEFQRTIITICRLDNRPKRLDRFVAVAKFLPDYNFKIYGSGQDEALIKKMAKGIVNISFMGATNDVAGAHQKAGMFLMTSEYEGFGITIIESLSQATPVLIGENSFAMAKKIIQDGVNGFVCEKFSVDQVINKIKLIEQDYRTYSEQAYKSFEHFNAQSFIQQWKIIFSEL
jgi:glycosyltransferase involved in cell wall biosynthesis